MENERRRSMCPKCPDMRGTPVSVVNDREGQTVELRCPACHHVWHLTGLETLSERLRKILDDPFFK